jgi:predicted RNA-binding Zn-ribbon protein involved in translation (DUF1610 family)
MSDRDRSRGMLKQAILAVQAGRTKEARKLLVTLVQQNPRDVTAWVWLGKAMDDPAKRRDCFTRALQLDPGNEEARRGMVALLSGPTATGEASLPVREEPGESEELLVEGEEEDEAAAGPQQISAYPSPCPNCGAHLRYDVGRHALRCAHCGTEKAVPTPTYIVEWLGMPPDLSGADAQGELIRRETLRCRSCGATTAFSSRAASLACPYCGSPQVVRSKGQVYLVPPRALIPFEVDEEGAKEALYAWLAEGYWHPDDLAKRAELVELHGVYLPFWGFKGLAEVTFQLQGSGLALDTMPMLPSQQTQHLNVSELLIPGSLSIDERTQRQIEPFDLDQAVPFCPEYLAGWPAEVYQVALADATLEARGRMSKEARNKADALTPVLNLNIDEYDIGGIPVNFGSRSRQRNRQVTYTPTISTIRLDSFMHYILPMWMGTYRYRGRTYAFAVNGQTGKAGGEAPRGGTMGILTIVLGVVIVALVGFLLVRFWPAIVTFVQSAPQSAPEGAEIQDPGTAMYVGVGIMMLFVFGLFGAASQWKRIEAWFGKGTDQEDRH